MRSLSLALSLPLLTLTVGVLTQACGGGETVVVGRTDQTIKRQADGGPTGNGTTCSWDDGVSSDGTVTPSPNGSYRVGDEVPSPDGCNTCTCTEEGIACTEMACQPPPGGACTYEGKSYAKGARFPASDGCNTCSCTDEGGVACTEMACAKSCVVDGKTYQEGETWGACSACACLGGQVTCTPNMNCP